MTSLHNEFRPILNNYIAKRVNNTADVEDLLQEVFIRIYRNMAGVSRQESFRSWVFRITRNVIIDHYRRNGNVKAHATEMVSLADDGESFDSTKQLENCIHRFIGRLPEEYREIVMDSEIRGIRQKELAEKYNLEYPTLRSRIRRGRARLKAMFLDCCKIELDSRGNIMEAIPRPDKCR